MKNQYVIGLDFGTDSVRAVLIDASNGKEQSSHVHFYKRWKEGLYCNASINQFHQHASEHIESMEMTIKNVVKELGVITEEVKGICIDTTGSSPIPTNKNSVDL